MRQTSGLVVVIQRAVQKDACIAVAKDIPLDPYCIYCQMSTTYTETFEPMNHENDLDLCELLQTMKLDGGWGNGKQDSVDHAVLTQHFPSTDIVLVVPMAEDRTLQPDTLESSISTREEPNACGYHPLEEPNACGCHFLQAIKAQLESYPTTGGVYLDTIFTHREAFAAFPRWHGHRSCARGFSDLAEALAGRAWHPDRESDVEAAIAFRCEAMRVTDHVCQ